MKGRYLFVCLIEVCTLLLMAVVVVLRMTMFADNAVFRGNALMNANLFALGGAFLLFGLFNWIFVGGFFKTAYKLGRPFVTYIVAAFIAIAIYESLHHIPWACVAERIRHGEPRGADAPAYGGNRGLDCADLSIMQESLQGF